MDEIWKADETPTKKAVNIWPEGVRKKIKAIEISLKLKFKEYNISDELTAPVWKELKGSAIDCEWVFSKELANMYLRGVRDRVNAIIREIVKDHMKGKDKGNEEKGTDNL